MISAWELYLWTRLDFIHGGINVVIILSGAISALVFVAGKTFDEGVKPAAGVCKSVLVFCFIWIIIVALVPNKKDAAMIWIVPQLATVENAELLQGEAAEIYKLAKDALKESIGTETVTE